MVDNAPKTLQCFESLFLMKRKKTAFDVVVLEIYYGTQIRVLTEGFELRTACEVIYLTVVVRFNHLDEFGVPEFATLRQKFNFDVNIF